MNQQIQKNISSKEIFWGGLKIEQKVLNPPNFTNVITRSIFLRYSTHLIRLHIIVALGTYKHYSKYRDLNKSSL